LSVIWLVEHSLAALIKYRHFTADMDQIKQKLQAFRPQLFVWIEANTRYAISGGNKYEI
jgi:hypothetical protein